MTLRVLHFVPDLAVGGAERLLVTFARHRDRHRIDLRVGTLREGGALRAAIEREGVPVETLGARGLAPYCRREAIDVVVSHLVRADLVAGATIARRRRLHGRGGAGEGEGGAPVAWVSVRHNTRVFRGLRKPYLWIDRAYAARASALIAVSEAVARELRGTHAGLADRVEVIHNGVDPPSALDGLPVDGDVDPHLLERFERERSSVRRGLGLARDDFAIAHVGSLTEQKGHGVLLDALARLRSRRVRCRLVAFGEGALAGVLEAKIHKLGLADVVRLPGVDPGVAEKLFAFDLFAFPSRWEGFGLALVEAMASGLAVVASRIDGIAEIVEDGRSGVLVEPGDARELADAIASLIADPARREALGREARRRAEAFSAREATRRHEALAARVARDR